mgnify:CR=1 FL=1
MQEGFMDHEDFIYKTAHKKFLGMGYSDSDASYVASETLRKYKRGRTFAQALSEAIQQGKQSSKKAAS